MLCAAEGSSKKKMSKLLRRLSERQINEFSDPAGCLKEAIGSSVTTEHVAQHPSSSTINGPTIAAM
jgi:hypothetical protein